MNSDVHPSLLKNPHILESRNTRIKTQEGQTQGAREPGRGNLYTDIDLGDVVSQSQRFVITVDDAIFASPTPFFFTINSGIFIGYDTIQGVFAGVNITQFQFAFAFAIPFPYTPYLNVSSSGTNQLIIDVIGISVQLAVDPSMADLFDVVMTREIVVVTEAGELKELASYDLTGTIYIWSAASDTLPANTGHAVGEIGRATKSEDYGKWNYTRLLRSRDFKMITSRPIDRPQVERAGNRVSAYWCGDDNRPRVFYVDEIDTLVNIDAAGTTITAVKPAGFDFTRIANGATVTVCGEARVVASTTADTVVVTAPFTVSYQNVNMDVQDMALSMFVQDAKYQYGFIDNQTTMLVTDCGIRVSAIIDGFGGALKAGGKRFIVRGVFDDNTKTPFGPLSDEVNVYASEPDSKTIGSNVGDNTGKKVTITISNIDFNLYSHIEVSVIEYDGISASGTTFTKIPVSTSIITFTYFGTEANATDLDLATLNSVTQKVVAAQSNLVLQNRIGMGGIRRPDRVDFQPWTGTFTHQIVQTQLPYTPTTGDVSALKYGEYMNGQNVAGFGSFMLYETVRIAAHIECYDGFECDVWVDDILFDTSAVNTPTASSIYGNRRLAPLANIDLTDASRNVYTYGLFIANINWEENINGTLAKDLIRRLEFVMVPMSDFREILTTGYSLLTTGKFTDGVNLPANFLRPWFLLANKPAIDTFPITDHQTLFFYSPDLLFQNISIQFQDGDQLMCVCVPPNDTTLLPVSTSRFYDFRGDFTSNSVSAVQSPIDINGAENIKIFDKSGIDVKTIQSISGPSAGTSAWAHEGALILRLDSDILNAGTGSDNHPLYYCYYKRPIDYIDIDNNKFGRRSDSIYESKGWVYTGNMFGTGDITVYGNECFNQKTFVKMMYPTNPGAPFVATTNGLGVSFYSQNYCNSQMRYASDDENRFIYPYSFFSFDTQIELNSWVTYFYLNNNSGVIVIKKDEFLYSRTYNYQTLFRQRRAIDLSLPYSTEEPNAIIYSFAKPQNGTSDTYRAIPEGNIYYTDATDGGIVALREYQGEMYAFHPYDFHRLFFNRTATMQAGAEQLTDITIGNSAVLSHPGYRVTKFGATHREGIILGTTRSGDDYMAVWSGLTKKVYLFGPQGTVPISDESEFSHWFIANTDFTLNHHSPTYQWGITGGFDQRNAEFLFTFRAQRSIPLYAGTAVEGQVYSSPVEYAGNFYTFQNTLYRAKSSGANPIPTGATDDPYWEFVDLNDREYYNFYTVVLSTQSNGFPQFYDFVPKLYMPWTDTYLTGKPKSGEYGKLYEHNEGDYIPTFWDEITPEASVTTVFNDSLDIVKGWKTVACASSEAPDRMELTAIEENTESFLVAADFTQPREYFEAAIRNDSTVSVDNPGGDNDILTARLKSEKLRVKFIFAPTNTPKWLLRILVRGRELRRSLFR